MRGGCTEYCPNCYSWKHPLWRAVKGFVAYHAFRWWPLSWRRLPPFLATAGDWIYDTRACGCGVPLERDQ
jgi:hypothetical protein